MLDRGKTYRIDVFRCYIMTFEFWLHIKLSAFILSDSALKHNCLRNSVCYDFREMEDFLS